MDYDYKDTDDEFYDDGEPDYADYDDFEDDEEEDEEEDVLDLDPIDFAHMRKRKLPPLASIQTMREMYENREIDNVNIDYAFNFKCRDLWASFENCAAFVQGDWRDFMKQCVPVHDELLLCVSGQGKSKPNYSHSKLLVCPRHRKIYDYWCGDGLNSFECEESFENLQMCMREKMPGEGEFGEVLYEPLNH
jgi:hypothetical protein